MIYCGALPAVAPQNLNSLLGGMSELSIISDISLRVFFTDTTSNIRPEHWIALARFINKNYESFDGFVVLHGIDNVLYTASALSFLIQNSSKPIIFTVGQSIQKTARSSFFRNIREVGMKANLINAIQVATLPLYEVGLVSGNRLLRANQAWMSHDSSVNIFDASENATLGRIDFSVRIIEKNILKPKGKIQFYDALEKLVCSFHIHPALDFRLLKEHISQYRGAILDLGELEALPQGVSELIGKISKKTFVGLRIKNDIELVVPKGNVCNVSSMLLTTSFVKLMWALKAARNMQEVRRYMQSNQAGEMT